jgi:hypothetical protein
MELGNGFSGTLSLEDPTGRNRAPVVDATVAGFFAVNGAIAGDTGLTFRMPDIILNLRVDQVWGFAGVSAALHEVAGAYDLTPNNVDNGHPADRRGFALAAGAKLNLPGGDMIGVNACYTAGAAAFCNRQTAAQVYDASTGVAAGWITDGVFGPGTEVELTRAWSILAAYERRWNARWRTSWFGGYAAVDYDGTATAILNSALVAGSVCPRPFAGLVGNLSAIRADAGNSCNPDYSFYEIGTRTQWNPTPLLDIGLELLYTHHYTAYNGPALYTANGSRPSAPRINDQGVWSAFFRWQRNFYP